jgi:hypothetical protein
MAEQKEKVLAKGIYVEKPSTNAPDWVIAKVSFKMSDALPFLQQHENKAGYVNLDVLMTKDGSKFYAALNQFEPKKPDSLQSSDVNEEEIPF